jgi:hypothetical protein
MNIDLILQLLWGQGDRAIVPPNKRTLLPVALRNSPGAPPFDAIAILSHTGPLSHS